MDDNLLPTYNFFSYIRGENTYNNYVNGNNRDYYAEIIRKVIK